MVTPYFRPPNSETSWPAESIDEFEQLAHCAQWKPLWARIVEASRPGGGEHQDSLPRIELFQSTAAGNSLNRALLVHCFR